MTKFILAIIAIFAVVMGFEVFRFLSAGPGKTSEEVIFAVPSGKSFRVIAEHLEQQGLVGSSFEMRVLAKLQHQDGHVKTGEYALNRGMTPQEILGVLISGKSIQYPVTFPEGANMYEMAQVLEDKKFYKASEFLKACRDEALIHQLLGVNVSSLEGYLFPETYNVTRFTPVHELIAAMVQNFKTAYMQAEGVARAGGLTSALPRHQMVILASMVEKETGAPQDRPLIASVFYNRLKIAMKLQSDPTIIYGIWVETGKYKNNITKADILRSTPYNTYTVPRLPFGPIANPGREALNAVLRPANTQYLYFVSHNDGTTAFSKTYEEQIRAVKKYQLNPAAREGKSWRDLKKRQAGTTGTKDSHP